VNRPPDTAPGKRLRRTLLIGAALVILLYGVFGMFDLFDAWQMRRTESLKRHLRLELDRAIAWRGNGCVLLDAAWPIHEALRSGFGRFLTFKNAIDRMNRDFGQTCSLFLFQNGRSTLIYPENASHKALVSEMLSAMQAPARSRARLAPSVDEKATALWGREATVENLRYNNGEYIVLDTSGRRGVGYFAFHGSGLAAVLLIENVPPRHMEDFLRHRARYRKIVRNIGRAIPDIDFWAPPRNRSAASIRMAWEKANAEKKDVVERNRTLWMFDRDRMGVVTAIAAPLPASHDLALFRTALLSIAIIAPLLLYQGYRKGINPSSSSLRSQMSLLFVAATLLPMLSTFGVGWMSLGYQEERLRNAAFAKGVTKLHTVNAGFSRTMAIFREKFLELWKLANRTPFDLEGFSRRLAPLEEARMCRLLMLFDADSRAILQRVDPDRNDIVEMSTLLSRAAIRRYIPERLGTGDGSKIQPTDLLVEEVTTNPEFGWSTLIETPNAVHRLQAGFSPADVIWNVFPDLATGPAFLMGMSDSDDQIRLHLSYAVLTGADAIRLLLLDASHMDMPPVLGIQNFSTLSAVMRTPRLSAAPPRSETASLDGSRLWPQPGTPDREKLMHMMQVCHLTNKVMERELRLASGTAWVVAAPEAVLGKYVTAAVLDAEQELSSLNGMKLALLIGLLASLLTSFAAGHLLSALVLIPIADLQDGIDAIRRRRSDIVIPCRRDDEFGHLAKIFNRALGDLKDLELARVVQTSLLPASTPLIEGFSLAAVNLPATDLSGDYYDLMRCPDGSFLMVIGDVTGHGASAALAMAMAKATVAYRLADGETGPGPLMTSLNDVFFQELRGQRKFMTMLTARLVASAHLLTVESAGHNYPLHYRAASKQTEFLPMTGFPLGARQKTKRDTIEISLEPGDAFVMYTDGYTECLLPNGNQLGDDTLRDIVDSLAGSGKDARGILDGLLMELNIRRAPGPLGDDVTLVVLRRDI